MQKPATLQFWDDFYEKEQEKGSSAKEWIVHPHERIFNTIAQHLVSSVSTSSGGAIASNHSSKSASGTQQQEEEEDDEIEDFLHVNALEIGCGNSEFSLKLWEYLISKRTFKPRLTMAMNATDVSPICIQQNLERDTSRIDKIRALLEGGIVMVNDGHEIDQNDPLSPTTTAHTNAYAEHAHGEVSSSISPSSFEYNVLNVLQPNETLCSKHSLILDKGCLDTFLFRSSKKQKQPSNGNDHDHDHPPIIRTLLDNIHTWLRDDGKYVILTPRNKIRSVRDYRGFSSVERIKLNQAEEPKEAEVEIEGINSDRPTTTCATTSCNSGGGREHDRSGGVKFQVTMGCLDGRKGSKSDLKNATMFMYVCTKNNNYKVNVKVNGEVGQESEPAFRGVTASTLPAMDECCDKCGMSFGTFVGRGEVHRGKSAKAWIRRWTGHKLHCRGGVSQSIGKAETS